MLTTGNDYNMWDDAVGYFWLQEMQYHSTAFIATFDGGHNKPAAGAWGYSLHIGILRGSQVDKHLLTERGQTFVCNDSYEAEVAALSNLLNDIIQFATTLQSGRR